MFHILVILNVKRESDIKKVGGLLQEVSVTTLKEEPCCKKLDIYHSEADPSLFILCEEWNLKADWEAHREEKAYKEIYLPKVLPLVQREPHISQLICS